MRLLLDTHALLWWGSDQERLSRIAKANIEDDANEIFVSAATAWEIAIKFNLGKLPTADFLVADFEGSLDEVGFISIPMLSSHAIRAGKLPGPHKDPFDRMLIAQAHAEDMAIVSNETLFDYYGVRRLW